MPNDRDVLKANAIEYLQSLAILAVQAQRQIQADQISSVADLLYDMRADLDRAENIVSTLEG